jgi:hypothetical protein
VFDAYALANRLDLSLATWDKLASQGVDIGPIGSSALIKACARQMDLDTAKQVSVLIMMLQRVCVWRGGGVETMTERLLATAVVQFSTQDSSRHSDRGVCDQAGHLQYLQRQAVDCLVCLPVLEQHTLSACLKKAVY